MQVVEFLRYNPPILAKMLYAVQQHQLLVFRERCIFITIAAKQVLKQEDVVHLLQDLLEVHALTCGSRVLVGGHTTARATARQRRVGVLSLVAVSYLLKRLQAASALAT